ncbi:hypothetical protein DFJ58DRAFT_846194 [Suillus subalutaceus]|uniref:uncharacterized protein n=1 Tax=Suillus subalutaceus TaxID=48586 RepID=UPI001B85C02B|nr:uncharacterized protein DFJ58DRAFT_846194 [Suillus subalutaceus]KAG1838161.1 hypothetical protein DFJ58DRAFT_846194 [Suillus subalutaceus]
MSPTVWLYVPAIGEILQLIQLAHEEHPFISFTTGSYVVVGYLANHNQIAAIYCEKSFQVAQPWTGRLTQLGWLIIPGEGDATHLHELFTTAPAGGAYISAITPTYCRADSRGIPMPTWLLQELLNASVQFSYAPFPNGYPPPAPTPIQQLTYEALPSDNSSALDHALSDGLLAPTSFDLTPTELQELDCGYNYWGLSTITSLNGVDDAAIMPFLDKWDEVDDDLNREPVHEGFHPDLQWRRSKDGIWATLNKKQRDTLTRAMKKSSWWRIVMLTRAIFVGAMWVGERPNPFEISQLEVQHRVTNIFLTALHLCDTTYDEMKKLPVTVKFTNGGTISAGWLEFHVNVYKVISELVGEHAFLELLWASLFHPISKLANGKGSARLANFFSEEIFSDSSCLGQKPVCNLMTLLYQSMVTIMKEKCASSEKIEHLEPEVMNGVLMSALNEMMNNILPIAPRSGLPRIMTDENGKRLRNMTDVEPIEFTQQPIIHSCIVVPNSTKGFSSPKSLRFSSPVPPSYFSARPIAY